MDSNNLKNLHGAKNYLGICDLWDAENKKGVVGKLGKWDYIYIMNGLYFSKRYSDCLDLYKIFHEFYKDDDGLNDKMGWSLYQLYIKGYDFSKYNKDIYSKAEFLIKHCSDSIYSPKGKVILMLTDHIAKQETPTRTAMTKALDYLKIGKVESFSKDESQYQKDGKTETYASDLEKWFSRRSKFTLKTEQYQECILASNEALNKLSSFHSNNDVWLRYRLAKSYLALNRLDEAIKLKSVLEKRAKIHWSIYQVLFEISVAEKSDSALEFAGHCASLDGSHAHRKTFYKELAEYLYSLKMFREAMLHRQLVLKLNEQDDNKVVAFASNWNISEDISKMNIGAVLRELKEIWKTWKESNLVFLHGVVNKILANGNSGFIKDDKGNSYYFNGKDVVSGKKKLVVGAKVKYTLVDRLDKSKNVVKPSAVNITVLG